MEKKVNYITDYKKPEFLISQTELHFTILADKIVVESVLHVTKNDDNANNIILNGEDFTTTKVQLNGGVLTSSEYSIENNLLTIFNVPNNSIIECTVEIDPFNNTKLMGIYKSQTCISSQCEPEGFRRITWFIDRPDVMSLWKVSITANSNDYPILLSNGNLIDDTSSGNIRTVVFEDPFVKPSYLFAFVAGAFDVCEDTFTTKSGKKVKLNVFVEKGKKNQGYFALESLQRAMKWDEDTFKLEYELEVFSIVAVSDFNFGAMENKSLNIFNEAYVLADHFIATDDDYFNIESIVAHEYFHNFTGNRITCRDWFQLTLKEGLTVFRDHIFSEDLRDKDIVRIADVDVLRSHQFSEDNGPLAHPIRPQSYIEMNNFYTSTVYEKGAEVIRMIETIIGKDKFKLGIDTYFEHFDGQAVTCEDFVWSMEKASGISLEKFKRWYSQSGTPTIKVSEKYDEISKEYTILLTQINKPSLTQQDKQNLVIPIRFALFTQQGQPISLLDGNKEQIAIVDESNKTCTFMDMESKPTLSINRGFSAPVILEFEQSDEDLLNLMKNDTDGFIRYESSQKYLKKHMLSMIKSAEQGNGVNADLLKLITESYLSIVDNYKNNIYLTSLLLKIPVFSSFEREYTTDLPIESIIKVIAEVEKAMAQRYEKQFLNILSTLLDKEEEFSTEMMAIRSLKNRCLYYLVKTQKEEYLHMVHSIYQSTKSMTKRIGILVAIKDYVGNNTCSEILSSFYEEYKNYATVLNKWFGIQASIIDANSVNRVKKLTELDTFSYNNPNKVRYLFNGFANNQLYFHNLDGSGYKLLEDTILKMDSINPTISAGLAKVFAKFNLYDKKRQNLMLSSIKKLLSYDNISKGLYEVLSKSLPQ